MAAAIASSNVLNEDTVAIGPNGLAYEVGALEGWGTIAGQRVPCGTAEFQVRSHSNYEPDVDDYRDVRALCDRFGLALPAIYERFE